MPDGGDAKLFKVLRRQAGKNRRADVICRNAGSYRSRPSCRSQSATSIAALQPHRTLTSHNAASRVRRCPQIGTG